MATRIERDCLGEMEIPDDLYYGIQTTRVMGVSGVLGEKVIKYPYLHRALTQMKKAAALANAEIGALSPEIAQAIAWACDQVLTGKYDDQFPLDMFQGGGYTCVNMNINEVVGNLANEHLTGHKGQDKVHPNTHVNMGQSTNDVVTSAEHLCIYPALDLLAPELDKLADAFQGKADEFADVVKVGRTCLQDAVPLTLGQEFGGYAEFCRRQATNIRGLRDECFELIVGATAVGTGMGAAPGYQEAFYKHLSAQLGENVRSTKNLFDGMQNDDFCVKVSAAVKQAACGISKIAKDLRIMSSGPRAGFGEITLPSLSPGSSIMPGKINPILPELVSQVAQQTCGNDIVISMAFEQGELEISVWAPTLYKNLFESFDLLTKVIPLFIEKCINGIEANRERCSKEARETIALSTVVAATLGYPEGVKVSHYAQEHNLAVADAVLEMGIMTKEEADLLLDPALLVDPARMSEAIAKWKKQKGKL
ncbi:MAG: aspartate ammonia-lyase [Burkholderiales bacterium]|nr:aspartate ammonia-lyase [Burkholderiales bacterium]